MGVTLVLEQSLGAGVCRSNFIFRGEDASPAVEVCRREK
jgi:hypothetical protein